MRKFITALILTLNSTNSHSQFQQPVSDTLKARLINVFKTVKQFSVYRKEVIWDSLELKILPDETNTLSQQDFKQRIRQLFSSIGDIHGALFLNGERISANDLHLNSAGPNLLKQLRQTNFRLHTKTIGKYGYILIPSNKSNENLQTDAQAIQDSLCGLHSQQLDGIIIDLRTNEGGSVYPLFAGLHQLIGNGNFGAFTDVQGKPKEQWRLHQGQLHMRKQIVASVKSRCKYRDNVRVVVLLSPITASAGEMLAIAFKGRKNTAFIGEQTYGLTTGVSTFRIQNYLLAVSTSLSADRTGKIYRTAVMPDIEIIGGDDLINLDKDAKILEAIRWFSSTNSR